MLRARISFISSFVGVTAKRDFAVVPDYTAPEDHEEVNSELVGKRQTIKSILEVSNKREGAMRNKNRAKRVDKRQTSFDKMPG